MIKSNSSSPDRVEELRKPSLETQREAAREWKIVGMSLAAGAAALEAMIETQILVRDRP